MEVSEEWRKNSEEEQKLLQTEYNKKNCCYIYNKRRYCGKDVATYTIFVVIKLGIFVKCTKILYKACAKHIFQ